MKLKNVEGMFGKSDPFFELRRTYDGPASGSWTPVYRSPHVKNNLNPKWGPATVDINALCDGDLDRRIQVAIFDHESSGKHVSMGAFETTVNQLLKASGSGKFNPTKGSKSRGDIVIDEAKLTGAGSASSASAAVVKPATISAAADPSVVPVPIPVPVQQFGGMSLGGGVPMPSQQKPTFVDYVSGNCDLNLVRKNALKNELLHYRCISISDISAPGRCN